MIAPRAVPALSAALTARLGPLAGLAVRERPWASGTLAGVRYRFDFRADHPANAAVAASLAEDDVPVRGGFVASLAVVENARDAEAWAVVVEALVIEE